MQSASASAAEPSIDAPITFEWSSEFLMTMLRHWSVMAAGMLLWLCAAFLLVSGAPVGLGITSAIGSVVLMGLCFFSNWNAPEEDFKFNVDGLEEDRENFGPHTEEAVDSLKALSVIDNRGQGDCLFLAVARGLIHLIQQEPRNNRQLLARWRALDPLLSDDIARDIEAFDISRIDDPLLDSLQVSLRKIYVQERKRELGALVTAPYTTLLSDFHFREFERFMQIAKGEFPEDLPEDSHNTFHDLIERFRQAEAKKQPGSIPTPEALFKWMIKSNSKLFMGCLEAMKEEGRWAGDDQVLVLGRAFNVSIEIIQADAPSDAYARRELIQGQPLLSVMNFHGTHWMTKIVRDTVAPLLEVSRLSM